MKTKMMLLTAVLATLSGGAVALDFTYPGGNYDDGAIRVIAQGRVVVRSYRDVCTNSSGETTLCNWGDRVYALYGLKAPKWIPVPAGSPIVVMGANSAWVYADGGDLHLMAACDNDLGQCSY